MMRKRLSFIGLAFVLAVFCGASLAGGVRVLGRDVAYAAPPAQATNLLRNPSFEGVYAVQDGMGTILVAPEWRAFYKDGGMLPDWAQSGASAGPIRKPEYKAATLVVDARRVRTGGSAQAYFVFYGVMLGGVQQTVNATNGALYQAGVFVQAWTDDSDDPCRTKGQMIATVGIDPYGGSDPWARRVVWADWQDANPGCGNWFEVKSPIVVAQGSQITVFHLAQHRWSLKHGDMYEDNAYMYEVPAGACPTPMVCPVVTPCLACPTPEPASMCPSLAEIRGVVRQECQFAVIWPQ